MAGAGVYNYVEIGTRALNEAAAFTPRPDLAGERPSHNLTPSLWIGRRSFRDSHALVRRASLGPEPSAQGGG